jgi:hypothetical protein
LNRAPLFAGQLAPDVLARFDDLFPRSRAIGDFVLRWKETNP